MIGLIKAVIINKISKTFKKPKTPPKKRLKSPKAKALSNLVTILPIRKTVRAANRKIKLKEIIFSSVGETEERKFSCNFAPKDG